MNNYQEKLKEKMNQYVHFVYKITKNFPKEELYGVVSQFRRSTLSIILNYIEGYARKRPLVRLNFLETSYGSLQESKYLLEFSLVEKYLDKKDYIYNINLAEEIGAMLWKDIDGLEKYIKNRKTIN
jgi:four helix bundle protein